MCGMVLLHDSRPGGGGVPVPACTCACTCAGLRLGVIALSCACAGLCPCIIPLDVHIMMRSLCSLLNRECAEVT